MNDTELDELLNTWQAPAVPVSLREGLRQRLAVEARPVRRSFGVRLRWAAAFALAAGTLAVGTSLVADGVVGSDTGNWDEHTYVRRTKIVHPFLAKLTLWQYMEGHTTGTSPVGGELKGSNYLVDRRNRAHYGYTWTAKPAGFGQYLFTVQPLDPAVVKEDGPIVPPGRLPVPAVVRAGSTFEVDLYNATGARVFDRYELSAAPMQLERHETPEQTAVTLTLTDPKLWTNGQFAGDSGGVREARGLAALVDVPDRGRFVLVLDPQGDAVYAAAGTAKGNELEFAWNGERFRVECSAPVVSGGERRVWVLRQEMDVRRAGFGAGGVVHPERGRKPVQ